jgi:hypothetical protein
MADQTLFGSGGPSTKRPSRGIEAVRFCLLSDGANRVIGPFAVGFAIVGRENERPDLHDVLSTFFVSTRRVCLFVAPAPRTDRGSSREGVFSTAIQ